MTNKIFNLHVWECTLRNNNFVITIIISIYLHLFSILFIFHSIFIYNIYLNFFIHFYFELVILFTFRYSHFYDIHRIEITWLWYYEPRYLVPYYTYNNHTKQSAGLIYLYIKHIQYTQYIIFFNWLCISGNPVKHGFSMSRIEMSKLISSKAHIITQNKIWFYYWACI